MAKAKKLKSGSWRCLVYDYTDQEGKRHYKSFTAASKKEAEYLAAEFALEKKKKCKSKKTFGKALDDYITNREAVLSPRTIKDYRYIQKNYFQNLMDIQIADITQELIQKTINAEARILSPKTVRDHHGLISSVLKTERPDFALNTALPGMTRTKLYVPSDDDVKRLIKDVAGTELELPVMLAAFGPMRRGEICALCSDSIEGNLVHVTQNMVLDQNNNWVIKTPKTYSGDRYIEFPDFVIEKLKKKNGRITTLNPDALTCRFRRRIRALGIKPFRFHDLRHYSASIQHAIGIPDAYIMQRGGWKSDGILKAVYRHTMDEQQKTMNQIVNSHFNEICNTKCNTKIKNP